VILHVDPSGPVPPYEQIRAQLAGLMTVDGPAGFTTDDSGAPMPWTADLTPTVCG
jgi:hypothetical protein